MILSINGNFLQWQKLSPQCLKAMKITVFLLTISFLQVHAKGFSQVTLSLKKAPMEKVFREIESQTGYGFLYTKEMLAGLPEVTINVRNATVKEVLNKCFRGQSLEYSIDKNTIVITRSPSAVAKILVMIPIPLPPPIEIHGKVLNQRKHPLQNVSILIAGTKIGTTTDGDGSFMLTTSDDKNIVLEISSVGYQTKRVQLSKLQTAIEVILEEENRGLNEVVIIGYGTEKKSQLIGSVSQINAKDIENRPVTQLSNVLTGQMPGVTVTQTTGRPGVNNGAIRIRGVGSFGASPNPLILLDGTPISNFNEIDPNNIASISVLKDASSAAIYGSRGANGVILVTTKLGSQGKTVVSYNGYAGFQRPTALPEMTNSYEYAIAYNEAKPNTYPAEALQKFKDGSDPDNYPNTNFLDAIITKKALQTGHNIGISGGSATNQFNLSVGGLFQDAIIVKNNYARYNARLNMMNKLSDKLKLTTRLSYINSVSHEPSSVTTIFDEAIRQPPLTLVYIQMVDLVKELQELVQPYHV